MSSSAAYSATSAPSATSAAALTTRHYEKKVLAVKAFLSPSLDLLISHSSCIYEGQHFLISRDNRTYWNGTICRNGSEFMSERPTEYGFACDKYFATTATGLLNLLTKTKVDDSITYWDEIFLKYKNEIYAYNDLRNAFRLEYLPRAVRDLEMTISSSFRCKICWIEMYESNETPWTIHIDTTTPKNIVLEKYPLLAEFEIENCSSFLQR